MELRFGSCAGLTRCKNAESDVYAGWIYGEHNAEIKENRPSIQGFGNEFLSIVAGRIMPCRADVEGVATARVV